MILIKYDKSLKSKWDEFVDQAKNSHFIFKRDFMEYHSNRFVDYSLVFIDDSGEVQALFPANISDDVIYSHQGLTFGGLLFRESLGIALVIEIFEILLNFLKSKNIKKLIYKSIPYIYHTLPAQEDLYAIFKYNLDIYRRDVSSTVFMEEKISYHHQRSRGIKKAIKNNLIFEESSDYKGFWSELEEVLASRHGSKPVHNIDEIIRLSKLFPDNIKLFVARKNNKIMAGTVVFENKKIAHTQYLMNSEEGRNIGALDYVLHNLLSFIYKDKKYFDLGTSNEDEGRYLNNGLISQKEGFGGRAVVHDFYEIEIK